MAVFIVERAGLRPSSELRDVQVLNLVDRKGLSKDRKVELGVIAGVRRRADVHNNFNVPVVVVGGKNLQVKANRHVKSPKGTPLANLMLGVMDRYGVERDKFGDSTAEIDLLTI